ncbi:MAG TPA: hypothetical protein QGH10_14200, partial [Armatimonadota bacterium]|nr:hypothetical protein [Armatimonadota bacterium]
LWTRELPEGYLVHRSAFIATPDIFYLIDGSSVLMLDSESGAEEGRISFDGITGDLTWIAMQNGVIYAQAQDDYAPPRPR